MTKTVFGPGVMPSSSETTNSAPNTDRRKLSDGKPRSKAKNKADPGPSVSLCPGCLKAGGCLASEQGGRGPGSPGQVRASVFPLFLKLPLQANLDQNSFNLMAFRPAVLFCLNPTQIDNPSCLWTSFLGGGGGTPGLRCGMCDLVPWPGIKLQVTCTGSVQP